MLKAKILTIFFGLTMFVSSCGTAYIVTDKGNDIYIDGQKKGSERVEITRAGFPTGVDIDIKQGNKVVHSERLKRRFTANTVIHTILFNWVGLAFAWQYPKSTYIKGEVKERETSIWSKPPVEEGIWNK